MRSAWQVIQNSLLLYWNFKFEIKFWKCFQSSNGYHFTRSVNVWKKIVENKNKISLVKLVIAFPCTFMHRYLLTYLTLGISWLVYVLEEVCSQPEGLLLSVPPGILFSLIQSFQACSKQKSFSCEFISLKYSPLLSSTLRFNANASPYTHSSLYW